MRKITYIRIQGRAKEVQKEDLKKKKNSSTKMLLK